MTESARLRLFAVRGCNATFRLHYGKCPLDLLHLRMIKTEEELRQLVNDLYLKAKEGLKPEGIKIELKGSWYNLSKNEKDYKINLSKFLKAITGLANTYGLTGYLIIGLNENDGTIIDSPFVKSGLRDKTDLYGLIVKHVDKPIRYDNHEIVTDIDGTRKTVTVIVIPPSSDKPHVIGNYFTKDSEIQNFIPVKKDTGTFPASRTDIDLMYYDNNNIIPEYGIEAYSFKGSQIDIIPGPVSASIEMPLIIDNYGRKAMIITKADLIITEADGRELNEELKMQLGAYSLDAHKSKVEITKHPIVIPSKTVLSLTAVFFSWDKTKYDLIKSGKLRGHFVTYDAVGNEFQSGKFLTGVV